MGSSMAVHTSSSLLKVSVLAALSCVACAASARTWTGGTPFGGTVSVLLQSQDAQTLFAGTQGGVFRSDDGGLHWSRKLAGSVGAGPAGFAAVALSDAHPGRLWLADLRGHIHRSDDNGESIAATTTLPVAGASITQLLAVPGANERLFAATSNVGLWYSEDGGASFARADADGNTDAGLGITQLVASAYNPSWFLGFMSVPWSWSFYVSTGGGIGWMQNADFTSLPTSGVLSSDGMMFVATSGTSHGVWRRAIYGGPWTGVAGGCWRTNSLLLDVAGQNVQWMGCDTGLVGLMSTPTAPPMVIDGAEAPIRQLLRDRVDPDRIWAASEHVGVFTSADAGQSWTARNEGLSGTSFRSVAVHPHSHRLYAGYVDEYTASTNPALMFSDDDGATWTSSDLGNTVLMTRAIAVDPSVPDVDATPVYAGGVDGTFSPIGLYKSLDGGRTFSTLGATSSTYAGTVRAIALDPRSCAAPPASGPCTSGPLQTFYAIATGNRQSAWRVIRSDDGGATLLDRSTGLPARLDHADDAGSEYVYPLALALDPHDAATIYIGTLLEQSLDSDAAPQAPSVANGVFRSRDGGATWQAASSGLPRHAGSADTAIDIYALAADPNVDGRLWAAGSFDDGQAGSHVFRSDDAGDHWSEQGTFPDCDIRNLLADPLVAGAIYASGRSRAAQGSGCMLRSDDAGKNWSRVDDGLPASNISALAIFPGEPGHLLVGSNSGVWQLRDAPDAIFHDGFD